MAPRTVTRAYMLGLAVVAAGVAGLSSMEAAAQTVSGDGARPRVRIERRIEPAAIYPRQQLKPTAVRECTAQLVQEHRASGTVIVPRETCRWRND